jgi:hypothetical protein
MDTQLLSECERGHANVHMCKPPPEKLIEVVVERVRYTNCTALTFSTASH